MKAKIKKLIINSPYEEPKTHWKYDERKGVFYEASGRRPAGYVMASRKSKGIDDPGVFIEIPLVNKIRQRVKSWRENGYPGITSVTRNLIEHWNNPSIRLHRLFFCQLDAMETLIWLTEAPETDRTGLEIPSDGGAFQRFCSKMATGTGKTVVMAQLIAWQALNKITYPHDKRFSKNFFIVTPSLTVKRRLQVLNPSNESNYYDEFGLIPPALFEKLRQAKIVIENWHALHYDTDEKLKRRKSVDKRGEKSDQAFTREVLGDMARASNIMVINDEAHHAWRIQDESKLKKIRKEELEEATIWMQGLDKIHAAITIQCCYDFSATPFVPSGKTSTEEMLFKWIVSDFGLWDAIESGLVKTPQVAIRDDSILTNEYKSRFFHIYKDDEVMPNLTRAEKDEIPLPDLVVRAYHVLGIHWLETAQAWKEAGIQVPPVMITIANRTETAARINYFFSHNKCDIHELCDPKRILHIDSKVLEKSEEIDTTPGVAEELKEDDTVEESGRKLTQKESAQLLRLKVDTVGKAGMPGEQIHNVISVAMLTEGWDAKTVTHIMGLRAFSSQLLCEQVVGRGLRRTAYDIDPETNLYEPEYVNIFGIPFSFMPHEIREEVKATVTKPIHPIEVLEERSQYELKWPHIVRIDHSCKPSLHLDMSKIEPLELDAYQTPTLVEMAPIIDGKPDISKITEIDLTKFAEQYRMQRLMFQVTRDIFDQMKPNWKGNKESLLAQVIQIVDQFIHSKNIRINPPLFFQEGIRRRIIIALNLNKIVQHLWQMIIFANADLIEPIYDSEHPIRSTSDMRRWYTTKARIYAKKSPINACVCDSKWEGSVAMALDRNNDVDSWVKNDHLGFEIPYFYNGVVSNYRPDFIARLGTGDHVIIEVKGQETQRDKAKEQFLKEWIEAVNKSGGFGHWHAITVKNPADLPFMIEWCAGKTKSTL